jgi:Kae1-associated kinase Bud32
MIIAQGAEAVIRKDKGTIIKERLKKDYRIDQIDDSLRKFRTKREAKIIEKVNSLGFGPTLIDMDTKDMKLKMEFIDGSKLRDVLHKNPKSYSRELGEKIATLHTNNIIHGDLTTSNMIVKDDKIIFIDFGLSFVSTKVEDMAVDLHLLKQALESKHSDIYEECFEQALEGYKNCKHFKEVMTRFEQVEKRGRNKGKG